MRRAIHAAVIPAVSAKGRSGDELDRLAILGLRRRGRTGILRPIRRRAKRDGSVVVTVGEIMPRSPSWH